MSDLVRGSHRRSASVGATASVSHCQPEAASSSCGSQPQLAPASVSEPARQRASLASQTEKQTEIEQRVSRAGSEVGRRSEPMASQLIRQVGSHGSSGQFAAVTVLQSVALLYESPGGNQVDGLPPVPTYGIGWALVAPLAGARAEHTNRGPPSAALHGPIGIGL